MCVSPQQRNVRAYQSVCLCYRFFFFAFWVQRWLTVDEGLLALSWVITPVSMQVSFSLGGQPMSSSVSCYLVQESWCQPAQSYFVSFLNCLPRRKAAVSFWMHALQGGRIDTRFRPHHPTADLRNLPLGFQLVLSSVNATSPYWKLANHRSEPALSSYDQNSNLSAQTYCRAAAAIVRGFGCYDFSLFANAMDCLTSLQTIYSPYCRCPECFTP
mgnify:CR=1 FL=1